MKLNALRRRRPRIRRSAWRAAAVWSLVGLGAGSTAALIYLAWRGDQPTSPTPAHLTLSAPPSPGLLAATAPPPATTDFDDQLADLIRRDGCLTVTIHVGLADHERDRVPARFGDGNEPRTNYFWGALYGLENHLLNAAGWRRAYRDNGDGRMILRRTVLHRRVAPQPAWMARGIGEPFDIYVLAQAWRASAAQAAVRQPLREALGNEETVLAVDGVPRSFGSGSSLIGYYGPNPLAEEYSDPLADVEAAGNPRLIGVFYICAMSAVYFHPAVIGSNLYPVLFTRRPLVTEGYLAAGMLDALTTGELGDGFLDAAAAAYVAHQKGLTPTQARSLLYR